MKYSILKASSIILIWALAGLNARPQSVVGLHAFPSSLPQSAASWERYTYTGEEFSVELPQMPFVRHTARKVLGSTDEYERARVYGLYNDDVIYMIYAYDEPRNAETLDYFVEEFAARNGAGTLDFVRSVSRNNFTGKQYALKYNDVRSGSFIAFWTAKHAYIVASVGADYSHAAVKRFFDSFTLGGKPAGRTIQMDAVEKRTAAASSAEMKPGAQPGAQQNSTANLALKDGAEALQPREVTRKAVIVYKPEPNFTEEARRNNVTGMVKLRCVLSSTGRVTAVSVIKGLPDGLTETAIRAARHILFFPAIKDDKKVSQWITIEYNFNIY
ncbi:MAG TPA: energy transducer TonB [Pyrinomonadaceae bacterium]|jgi:TonB family protein